MENNQSSLRVNGNDLILHGYEVDQGPYRLAMYQRVAEEDYTATTETTGILGADCVAYLNRYFPGFRFLKTVKEVPSRGRNRGFYKMVRFVLRFDSDADAETARRHITTAGYYFDFQYRPAVPGPNK